jgi:hypothetical protein
LGVYGVHSFQRGRLNHIVFRQGNIGNVYVRRRGQRGTAGGFQIAAGIVRDRRWGNILSPTVRRLRGCAIVIRRRRRQSLIVRGRCLGNLIGNVRRRCSGNLIGNVRRRCSGNLIRRSHNVRRRFNGNLATLSGEAHAADGANQAETQANAQKAMENLTHPLPSPSW